MICPCDFRLAMIDGRWRFDWRQYFETNFERMCIYERMPWGQSTQVWTKANIICLSYFSVLTLQSCCLYYNLLYFCSYVIL